MDLLLAFSLVLLAAVLLSDLARRSVLSTAVLFLVAGFVLGDGVLGWVSFRHESDVVRQFAEVTLFAVLYTDGMKVGVRDLLSAWRLPGRALLLGMPIGFGLIALFARPLTGLPWAQSLLLAAALTPTDPVFAAAIVGREEVPYRVRHLLNVESGLNDGLVLPVVIVLLGLLGASEPSIPRLLEELGIGLGIGVGVSFVAVKLQMVRFLKRTEAYLPLHLIAVGLAVFALTSMTGGNAFLGAFAAGITVRSVEPAVTDGFHAFGETVTEILKLAALMLFGAAISPSFLASVHVLGWVFAVLTLFVARPLSLAVALFRSGLDRREWVTTAWFGPKGFASVVYGLLILQAGIPEGNAVFHLVAGTIVLSILAHSSTDVVVARWFRQAEAAEGEARSGPHGAPAAGEDLEPAPDAEAKREEERGG